MDGSPVTVFESIQHAMRNVWLSRPAGASDVYVVLDTFADPANNVLPNVNFNATISAIGDFVRQLQTVHAIHFHVTLVLPPDFTIW
jgi:hypothetical protein